MLNRFRKFFGRPSWLLAVFVFTTAKLPIPGRSFIYFKSSFNHCASHSCLRACRLADTPTRPYADTASFVVAATPRCDLCDLLCNLLLLPIEAGCQHEPERGSSGATVCNARQTA